MTARRESNGQSVASWPIRLLLVAVAAGAVVLALGSASATFSVLTYHENLLALGLLVGAVGGVLVAKATLTVARAGRWRRADARALAIGIVGVAVSAATYSTVPARIAVRHTGGRGISSFTSLSAEREGLLVRRIPLATPVVTLGDHSVRLREAWIERRSVVRYYFFWFFRGRQAIPGYDLCLTTDSRWRLALTMGTEGAETTSGDRVVDWDAYARGDSLVNTRPVAEPFPDSVRVGFCEHKRGRDGSPLDRNHDWLPPCPGRTTH